MTDKFDDGGSMHPIQAAVQVGSVVHLIGHASKGMSLWDYYAGQAMQGIAANPEGPAGNWGTVCHDAANAADAMIAEKRRREQND